MKNANERPDRSENVERLAAQIANDLRALATPLPQSSINTPAGPVGPAPGWTPSFDLAGPRTVLEGGARFVSPFLPGDARFRRAKALLLRALRIITRDQAVFNSAVTESLRIAFRELEGAIEEDRRRIEDAFARSQAVKGEFEEALNRRIGEVLPRFDELEKRQNEGLLREISRREANIASLKTELEKEGRARNLLGNELEKRLTHRDETRGRLAASLNEALEREGKARNRLADEMERRLKSIDEMRAALGRDLSASIEREGKARNLLADDLEKRLTHQEKMRALLSSEFGDALSRENAARESIGNELIRTQRRIDRLEEEGGRRLDELKRLAVNLEETDHRLVQASRQTGAFENDLRLTRLEFTALRGELQKGVAPGPVSAALAPSAAPATSPAASLLHAGLYTSFEDQFRGSEEDVRKRQREDGEFFRGVPGPVLDLGCGRGEFLEILKDLGISASGCDLNPVSAARGREKGLNIAVEDLFSCLQARNDASLGGITAFQVVEHLQPADMIRLVELAVRKLAFGGRILLETVNPESLFAMKWFWMDLTHVRPVPGPALSHLLEAAGFRDVKVLYRSPVPEGIRPPDAVFEDPVQGPMARLLFGDQDVAVTGVK